MKYKNAISGLVVVVLLVAIAVAITAMFVNWISSMAGKNLDSAKMNDLKAQMCGYLYYQILDVKITDHSTYSTMDLVVQNEGNNVFHGFAVQVFAKNGTEGSVNNHTAGAWVKNFFNEGSIGKLQTGNIVFNVSIPKADLASIQYFPLVNVTVPAPTTITCSNSIRQLDLSPYISSLA